MQLDEIRYVNTPLASGYISFVFPSFVSSASRCSAELLASTTSAADPPQQPSPYWLSSLITYTFIGFVFNLANYICPQFVSLVPNLDHLTLNYLNVDRFVVQSSSRPLPYLTCLILLPTWLSYFHCLQFPYPQFYSSVEGVVLSLVRDNFILGYLSIVVCNYLCPDRLCRCLISLNFRSYVASPSIVLPSHTFADYSLTVWTIVTAFSLRAALPSNTQTVTRSVTLSQKREKSHLYSSKYSYYQLSPSPQLCEISHFRVQATQLQTHSTYRRSTFNGFLNRVVLSYSEQRAPKTSRRPPLRDINYLNPVSVSS